ncbi:general odorant-binding protein lush [Calliphora vicina]|uniref:general odorant-binding protein lush n=1 Tax=Calliphora vicina TaxID=7373 RepID=UPI00325A5F14
MKLHSSLIILKFAILSLTCIQLTSAVTMEQFDQSLDMMRNGCAPKFKVSLDQLDKLRNGFFDESSSELKCYTKCVAQLAGTVTKKGDFSIKKAIAQIPIILPPEIQETAKAALASCEDIQKDYKESCERVFYVTKCVRDFAPEIFKFP